MRRCGLSDIVKRRSLRASGRDENLVRARNLQHQNAMRMAGRKSCDEHGGAMLVVLLLDRRERRYDLEASWSF
jgi:hypothetical protein